MSTAADFNRAPTDSNVTGTTDSQRSAFYILGGLLQLLAISLFIELLLGFTESLGLILRLSLLAIIMTCVVLRLGWLVLVAIQVSLFFQEPLRQPLEHTPSGLFFVLASLFAIVAAMKIPQTHKWVTDVFLTLFRIGIDQGSSTSSGPPSESKDRLPLVRLSFAFWALHGTLIVIFAVFLLTKVPVGRQYDSWLQWSLKNSQAVWPGALLMVLMIAMLVVVRENAWRQLEPSQARLYLRSIQLIANYRDLFGFERHRLKKLRKKQSTMRSK
jgi:hypothetical protein